MAIFNLKSSSIALPFLTFIILPGCAMPNKSAHNKTPDPTLLLQGSLHRPRLYLLENRTKHAFYFNHETHHAMSAGWASNIDSGKWSAFLVNKPDFSLTCQNIRPNQHHQVNCAKSVTICSVNKLAINQQQNGTYWVAENKTYQQLLKAITKRKLHFTGIDCANHSIARLQIL